MCGAPRAANPARSPLLTAQFGRCFHLPALFPLAQPRPDPSGPHGDRRGFGGGTGAPLGSARRRVRGERSAPGRARRRGSDRPAASAEANPPLSPAVIPEVTPNLNKPPTTKYTSGQSGTFDVRR